MILRNKCQKSHSYMYDVLVRNKAFWNNKVGLFYSSTKRITDTSFFSQIFYDVYAHIMRMSFTNELTFHFFIIMGIG